MIEATPFRDAVVSAPMADWYFTGEAKPLEDLRVAWDRVWRITDAEA